MSHRSAAALWGIRPTTAARFDVTVPRTSGFRSTAAILVHRPRRPIHSTTHEGIPVTTPGQTLADLATALPRRALEKAIEMAEVRKLDVVVPDGHPGLQRLRDAAADALPTTTDSPIEDAFLALCDAHGLPRPLVQAFVCGQRVDFCWPEQRVIVETDGYEHHGTRAAFERDRARDAYMTARGWGTIRATKRMVEEDPAGVLSAVVVLAARQAAAALEPGDRSLALRQRPPEHPEARRDPDLGRIEVGRVLELPLRGPPGLEVHPGLPDLDRVASTAEQSHRA